MVEIASQKPDDAITSQMPHPQKSHTFGHCLKISSPEDVSVVLRPDSADCIAWSLNEAAVRALGVRYLLWSGKKIHEPWVEYLGRSRLHFIYKMRENE